MSVESHDPVIYPESDGKPMAETDVHRDATVARRPCPHHDRVGLASFAPSCIVAPMTTSGWCDVLGIQRPDLAAVKDHREASTYACLLVALLEREEAMTLAQVARRFDEVGIASFEEALRSLKRCRPGRAPVYRDGDDYGLDPHDDELGLWVFRLGLRPPKVPPLRVVRPPPPPLPGDEVPLSPAELDEAWKDASLRSWSIRRLALAVLDAHGGGPLPAEDVVAFVSERTAWHPLEADSSTFKRKGCPVLVGEDGSWRVADDSDEALQAARKAVRERVAMHRKHASLQPDPAVMAARRKAIERKEAENAEALASMSRALVVVFPRKEPRAAALVDVGEQTVESFIDEELDELRTRLVDYDIIGAEDVRPLLRALGVDGDGQRLAELGPPQKTMTINQRGRTLKITTAMLVQGSCGISRPFGDPKKLRTYLAKGQETKLRRRLEADVKSLYSYYQYGRLHGAVRLRWGFLDEPLPVPWVHRDEPTLYHLKKTALERGQPLEVVIGNAPGWTDPWARARMAFVGHEPKRYRTWLVDDEGFVIDEADVQRARLR